VPEEVRAHLAPTQEERTMLDALPLHSAMSVYLTARGKPLGTLTFACASPRAFDEDDLALAEELGRRVAIAIENARLYRSAQDAIRAREDVLAMVSHDLRSPLTTIDTTVALLQRNAGSEEKVREKAEKVKQQVDRMSTLVSDLLDAAALEAGRLAIHREKHEVASCLTEMVETYRPVAERHQIRLEVVPPDPLPPVACDRVRIEQVFSNIIGNAMKFTPASGYIRVRTKGTLNEVEFVIEDSGPGISREELPHIFDRYRQAKGTLERGTGLGLFIVKGIIEAHGGRVWVESTPGQGSTFHFTLPVWRAPR
jgi:signal transduction histidine kinase